MKLHILFIQHKETHPGECAPEARIVWDEYAVEANPLGFEKACKVELANVGPIQASRVLCIEVDQDEIRRQLLETPTLQGSIVE